MAAEHAEDGRPKSTAVLRARPEIRRDLGLAGERGLTLDQFYALPEAEDIIASWEIERTTCKFHGGPVEECSDDDRDWFPQMEVCWPTAQLEAAQALYADQHEDAPYHDGSFLRWSKKRSRTYPFHYTDGVTFWLSPVEVDPDADWLGSAAGDEGAEGESPGD